MALDKFYGPYHEFIDMMFRLAVNNESVPEVLVNLSAVVGFEAVPLHSTYFPKLWLDILKAQVSYNSLCIKRFKILLLILITAHRPEIYKHVNVL